MCIICHAWNDFHDHQAHRCVMHCSPWCQAVTALVCSFALHLGFTYLPSVLKDLLSKPRYEGLCKKSPTQQYVCNGFRSYTPPFRTLTTNTGHLQPWYFPKYLLHTQAYASEKYLLLTILFLIHLEGQERGHYLCCC